MDQIIQLLQSVFYPFWYFLVLSIVLEISKMATIFLVAGGRLRSFHAIENYWIYLLVILFCVLLGLVFGHGGLIEFAHWSLCPLLSGLAGIHFGYAKANALTDEDLAEIADENGDDDE